MWTDQGTGRGLVNDRVEALGPFSRDTWLVGGRKREEAAEG